MFCFKNIEHATYTIYPCTDYKTFGHIAFVVNVSVTIYRLVFPWNIFLGFQHGNYILEKLFQCIYRFVNIFYSTNMYRSFWFFFFSHKLLTVYKSALIGSVRSTRTNYLRWLANDRRVIFSFKCFFKRFVAFFLFQLFLTRIGPLGT